MISGQLQFWLCTQPTDMRCQFDGLAARVKQHMGLNPLSGKAFVFLNRRGTMMKVLYFEPGGYCLWCKRLEQGQFARPGGSADSKLALSATAFQALLEGLELEVKKRRKRWKNSTLQAPCHV